MWHHVIYRIRNEVAYPNTQCFICIHIRQNCRRIRLLHLCVSVGKSLRTLQSVDAVLFFFKGKSQCNKASVALEKEESQNYKVLFSLLVLRNTLRHACMHAYLSTHSTTHWLSLSKTSGQSIMPVGGYGAVKGEEKKRGHLLTIMSLPQSLSDTHKPTHFSGSQRTFEASSLGA